MILSGPKVLSFLLLQKSYSTLQRSVLAAWALEEEEEEGEEGLRWPSVGRGNPSPTGQFQHFSKECSLGSMGIVQVMCA